MTFVWPAVSRGLLMDCLTVTYFQGITALETEESCFQREERRIMRGG